jgi:glycine/D-amino acid oxidase-like deaminating enzyme
MEEQGMPGTAGGVIIVGGGIIGCSTAYYLAKLGVPVTVYEKERVGAAQSGQNWGFVRQQGRDPLEIPLMIEGIRIWRDLEAEIGMDVEWTQAGNLGIAVTPQKLALFEGWARQAREHGLATRMLSAAEVSAMIPGMQGTWLGGMFTESDGHAEPQKAAPAIAAAARKLGATIVEGCAVNAIELSGGAVSGVQTERGLVPASCVVACGGAWTGKLLRPLGVPLPQRMVRSTVSRTAPVAPISRIGVWAPGVAFRQRRDGRVNLGGGGWTDHDVTLESLRDLRLFMPNYWKNRKLFQFHFGMPFVRDLVSRIPGTHSWRHRFAEPAQNAAVANARKCARTASEFQKMFPTLGRVAINESWAGYIDATPDAVPVISAVDKVPGLVVAAGFSGHGFGMGPVSGRLVAELVSGGKTSLDISGFRLSRFADGTFGKPRSVM